MDILDLSEEIKNFKHNGVTLNLDERYMSLLSFFFNFLQDAIGNGSELTASEIKL